MTASALEFEPSTSPAIRTMAKLFRGLADPSRLAVLDAVRGGPLCVTEVVTATGLPQPTVSMHLSCLWDCGLVERERRGKFVYYAVTDPQVITMLKAADDLLVFVGDQVFVCSRYGGES